jgi:hypothetical protein
MSETTVGLPKETTWKLLAVSPDMMDTQFCNKRFPFHWRSSLALSAFEPQSDDLPEGLCEGRITFLKVTATITGYQPSRQETEAGYASFPNAPVEELSRIIDQYFACYGAMLNVAVFPNPDRRVVDRNVSIGFQQHPAGTVLPNPVTSEGATFTAADQDANQVVDMLSAGGDAMRGLNLFQEHVVTLPATSRVQAKVMHISAAGLTMAAFSGETLVASQAAGTESGEVHELIIEGSGIDRVVFSAPQNEAALLEFAYLDTVSTPFDLIDFPHFIDVEPKIRDLIQAATETGEILTSSKSNIKTNKSLTHTESSETGYELAASGGVKDKFNVAGKLTHKNTEQEGENWSVATDASRERQEKEGSTTQLSQLYNLLSTYHVGTNRVQFLMLARPHVLQPTDHRTFVDGLRQIEGVQEFVLIVARPPEMRGLCVEAVLETGHFPEGLTPELPDDEFDERHEEFKVTAFADNGLVSGSCTNIDATHTVESGWVVDTRPERGPDAGHQGIREIRNDSNDRANASLEKYNYQRITDASVHVSGRICGAGGFGSKARFDRTYRVFTRSVQPRPTTGGAKVPIDRLLLTSRGLCVCYTSKQGCPELDSFVNTEPPDRDREPIVDERPIAISRRLVTRSASGDTRVPAMKQLLSEIQSALTTSWRRPQRREPAEAPGFLESDYFTDQIKRVLPREQLQASLANVSELHQEVVRSLGATTTVAEALDLDLAEFAKRSGLTMVDAGRARRSLLGMGGERGTGST